jgi:hypothetical protein
MKIISDYIDSCKLIIGNLDSLGVLVKDKNIFYFYFEKNKSANVTPIK